MVLCWMTAEQMDVMELLPSCLIWNEDICPSPGADRGHLLETVFCCWTDAKRRRCSRSWSEEQLSWKVKFSVSHSSSSPPSAEVRSYEE